VNKDAARLILLVAIVLLGIGLMAGAAVIGFIGLAFAGEPGSGGEVTGSEYLTAAAPLFLAIGLTVGLVGLWLKQYYKAALGIWLLSVLVIVPSAAMLLGF
jgi:hypothetical protein